MRRSSAGNAGVPQGILVHRSVDGGLHWTSRFLLDYTTDPRFELDKPSITADPANSRHVYAAWCAPGAGAEGDQHPGSRSAAGLLRGDV